LRDSESIFILPRRDLICLVRKGNIRTKSWNQAKIQMGCIHQNDSRPWTWSRSTWKFWIPWDPCHSRCLKGAGGEHHHHQRSVPQT
jgi:hypothetical protein